jgi:superfamily I DNA/RNA helicase
MKQRVSNVLDRPIRDFGKLDQRWPTICTFHSLCLRVPAALRAAHRPAGELHDLRLGGSDQGR